MDSQSLKDCLQQSFSKEELKDSLPIEPQPVVPFCKKRKKDKKIDTVNAWIKGNLSLNKEGRWSFIYTNGTKEIWSMYGDEIDTDKNRVILISLLELMEWIRDSNNKKNLIVYTNSLYVVNCISEWLNKWKRTDFKVEDDTYRPNSDILRKIDKLKEYINITVKLLTIENEFSNKANSLLTIPV